MLFLDSFSLQRHRLWRVPIFRKFRRFAGKDKWRRHLSQTAMKAYNSGIFSYHCSCFRSGRVYFRIRMRLLICLTKIKGKSILKKISKKYKHLAVFIENEGAK